MAQAATQNAGTEKNLTKQAARKKVKKEGRAKRKTKIATDKEFAKALFAAKSKRSADKKTAFRKKKKGK